MKPLIHKEFKLAAHPITWIFLLGTLMTLLPGYPILMGVFFVSFGLFQSFQNCRESNDVLYTVLLPVRKREFVSAKYVFVCIVQGIAFALIAGLTALRMTLLSGWEAYASNALMNASPLFLGFVLLIFAAFNFFFVRGFFKTAYKFGLPFLSFGIAALLLIFAAEALHHFPGLAFLNTPQGERLGGQFAFLAGCAVVYFTVTLLSCRSSQKRFEKLDL